MEPMTKEETRGNLRTNPSLHQKRAKVQQEGGKEKFQVPDSNRPASNSGYQTNNESQEVKNQNNKGPIQTGAHFPKAGAPEIKQLSKGEILKAALTSRPTKVRTHPGQLWAAIIQHIDSPGGFTIPSVMGDCEGFDEHPRTSLGRNSGTLKFVPDSWITEVFYAKDFGHLVDRWLKSYPDVPPTFLNDGDIFIAKDKKDFWNRLEIERRNIVDKEIRRMKSKNLEHTPGTPNSPRTRISNKVDPHFEDTSDDDSIHGDEEFLGRHHDHLSKWKYLQRLTVHSTDEKSIPWELWRLSLLVIAPFFANKDNDEEEVNLQDPDLDMTDSWMRYTKAYLGYVRPYNIGVYVAPRSIDAAGDRAFNAWGIVDEGAWKQTGLIQKIAYVEHISVIERLRRRDDSRRIKDSISLTPTSKARVLTPEGDPLEEGKEYVWDNPVRFIEALRTLLRHPRGAAVQLYGQETMNLVEFPIINSPTETGRAMMMMPPFPPPTSQPAEEKQQTLTAKMVSRILTEGTDIPFGKIPPQEELEKIGHQANFRPTLLILLTRSLKDLLALYKFAVECAAKTN